MSRLGLPHTAEELSAVSGIAAVVIDGTLPANLTIDLPACPVIATTPCSDTALADIELEPEMSLSNLLEAISQSPIAAATLVQLTRYNRQASVQNALVAESLAYSTLQHGQQFKDWLTSQVQREEKTFNGPAILASRHEDELTLTLNRPENRNAWSTAMRDALTENLHLACYDTSIKIINLQARGPCFGAGGDLTEFGDARDAGIAHVTRQTRSPALYLHQLRDKVRAYVHGACVGAGIELPAYASHIVAHTDSFFQLPEVAMGLIPGAGGTASILNRIGASRFNYLALSGTRLSAELALSWGLVEELTNQEPPNA